MYTLFVQVGVEDYEAYISELDAHGFEWEMASDGFTSAGKWCVLKVVTDTPEERDLAEELAW